jgi:phosphoribosylformylglycinamidine synthase subunit PurQ / glutaminase
MKIGVVTFPGSNCDADFRRAIDRIDGLKSVALWHKDTDLSHVEAVVLPGGFSYGDYLRCGAIARFSPMMQSVAKFAAQGRPVLGVCNGFQILCEAGLLPGVLLQNRDLAFLCKDVRVRVERTDTPWTHGLASELVLPIAHGEGNWQADDDTVARVEGNGQVVFRYVNNPNGARNDVAGLCSEKRNVVGLMPHPERVVDKTLGGTDGLGFLTSLLGVPA